MNCGQSKWLPSTRTVNKVVQMIFIHNHNEYRRLKLKLCILFSKNCLFYFASHFCSTASVAILTESKLALCLFSSIDNEYIWTGLRISILTSEKHDLSIYQKRSRISNSDVPQQFACFFAIWALEKKSS